MKYSKIVGKNIKNINRYFVLFIFTVLLFVASLYSLFISINGTFAWFTNTVLVPPYEVYYFPNWPSEFSNSPNGMYQGAYSSYNVLENQFGTPEGYEFVGWSTSFDGDGSLYQYGDVIYLEDDLFLFAQWRKISDIEDDTEDGVTDEENPEITDPDVDDPGDEGDSDGSVDDSEATSDDKNDEDSTIEGEGTEGDASTGDSNSSENSGTTSGSGGSGGGAGSSGGGSSTGGGSGSSGGNSGGNAGNSGTTSGSSNSSNSSSNATDKEENNEIEEDIKVPVTYEFKFISGNKEYANTKCDVLEDGKCDLVLPMDNPIKEGYTFKGWSLSNLCSDEDIVNNPIIVNKNGIYYACFEINYDNKNSSNKWIYLVVAVWVITSIIIYKVIKNFKNKEVIIDED